ncbi:hypothetical protein ACR3K2_25420 [Cryptosporidium serpentis]
MSAIVNTYCTSERAEFSLYGYFVRRRYKDSGGFPELILIKNEKIELYEISENKFRFTTSSDLIISPVSCCIIKGMDDSVDFIALLFSNWDLSVYKYDENYNCLKIVNRFIISVNNLLNETSEANIVSKDMIDMDDLVKMESLNTSKDSDIGMIMIMITLPKYILFVTKKLSYESKGSEEKEILDIVNCWGITCNTDLLVDTIVDTCFIVDKCEVFAHPRIGILTRIGPISNGAVQSHSNSVNLIFISLNIEIMDFYIIEKIELLPMDCYKLFPINTEKLPNIPISGGLIIASKSCIIIKSILHNPFTLVTINNDYHEIPTKKLEIDICVQNELTFRPQIIGSSNSSTETYSEPVKPFIPSLKPLFIQNNDLMVDLELISAVTFICTSEYYGLLLFNKVEPYVLGLILHLAHEEPHGFNFINWFKIEQYWDWTHQFRSYARETEDPYICQSSIGLDLKLENLQKRTRISDYSMMDSFCLAISIPIFPVQSTFWLFCEGSTDRGTILAVGDVSSSSGISFLDIEMKGIISCRDEIKGNLFSKVGLDTENSLIDSSKDFLCNINFDKCLRNLLTINYDRIVSSCKMNQNKHTKSKRIKSKISFSKDDLDFEMIEKLYIEKSKSSNSEDLVSEVSSIKLYIRDYMDLGPNRLRDFCTLELNNSNDSVTRTRNLETQCILSTGGNYPIGQITFHKKEIPLYIITEFSLGDILYHWSVNDIYNKSKFIVFTTDSLEAIGKTYIFSLEMIDQSIKKSENNDYNACNIKDETVQQDSSIIGDITQLDSSTGLYGFDGDCSTVGMGSICLPNNGIYIVQVTSSSLYVLSSDMSQRYIELDFMNTILQNELDAPMVAKCLIVKSFIILLLENSKLALMKLENKSDFDENTHSLNFNIVKGQVIAMHSNFVLVHLPLDLLYQQLFQFYTTSSSLIFQRSQEHSLLGNEDIPDNPTFWFRHLSVALDSNEDSDIQRNFENNEKINIVLDNDKYLEDVRKSGDIDKFLKYHLDNKSSIIILIVYSQVWRNGALLMIDLENHQRIVFFSPFISAVPALLRNVATPYSYILENTISRLLECEFDLGRPITCIISPIIEPEFTFKAEYAEDMLASSFSMQGAVEKCDQVKSQTYDSDQNASTNKTNIFGKGFNEASHLVTAEMISLNNYGEMLLIITINRRPLLTYKSFNKMGRKKYKSLGEVILDTNINWILIAQPNLPGIFPSITNFYPLFPLSGFTSSSSMEDTFSKEPPLSVYKCGHITKYFKGTCSSWIYVPPSSVTDAKDTDNSQINSPNNLASNEMTCNALWIIENRSKFSIVRFESEKKTNCISAIQSPWSKMSILLTTQYDHQIKFQTSQSPFGYKMDIFPPMAISYDNWLLRKVCLPEVIPQKIAFSEKYKLVALIVGIPDIAKHHLNGFHIQQMAFYRYLRCLEAGGKEAQTILYNQELIRNPEKCFEKSLASIPDLGIPCVDFYCDSFNDSLPPGIEIGEILPKLVAQAVKEAEMYEFSNSTNSNKKGLKQYHPSYKSGILRHELLIYSLDDLFPPVIQMQTGQSIYYARPLARFSFGPWEVGLDIKFGHDSQGVDVLIVGTGTNPTQYYEAEGRLLLFRVKHILLNRESNCPTHEEESNFMVIDSKHQSFNSNKWPDLSSYWPSRLSQALYQTNIVVINPCFSKVYRGPVTCVDLIDLPATTAPVAPAIPALAAYPILQTNMGLRSPSSLVSYMTHTFGYRLFIHEFKEDDNSFIRGTFMDTPLGITCVSHFKSLFFVGDIRRGIHLGMLRTDSGRGSQTMVKLARSHPLWKFTCTAAQPIINAKDMAILVADNRNNIYVFEPDFNATQIIERETLKPKSISKISTSIVNMKQVRVENCVVVIAIGQNSSFYSVQFIGQKQRALFRQLEKALDNTIPPCLGLGNKTLQRININNSIPSYIRNLYPTNTLVYKSCIQNIRYLSVPLQKVLLKNIKKDLSLINNFIV